ncbi:MAG: hypothetical protein LBI74_05790 [Synergistaceae bacterium]|jgi:hypothetical protein|nr:hypothetical protein [Synergistaceae bacterium]
MNKRRGRALVSFTVVTALGELVTPAISADNPQRPVVIVTPAVVYSKLSADQQVRDSAPRAEPSGAMPAEGDVTTVTCPNSIMFGEWLLRIQGCMSLAHSQESESVAENTLLKMGHLMDSILNSQYNHENRLSDVLNKARGELRVMERSTSRAELARLVYGVQCMMNANWQIILERRRIETPTHLSIPMGLNLPMQSLEEANLRRGELIKRCAPRYPESQGVSTGILFGIHDRVREYLTQVFGTNQISSESAMRLMALHDALRKNDLEYCGDSSSNPPESPTQQAARKAECVRKFREYAREIRGILGEG